MEFRTKVGVKKSKTQVTHLIRSGNIITITVRPHSQIDFQEMTDIVMAREQLNNGIPSGTILVLSEGVILSKAAREFLASVEDPIWSRNAIVCAEDQSSVVVDFYLKVNKPKTPTQAFRDKTSALAWLSGELS